MKKIIIISIVLSPLLDISFSSKLTIFGARPFFIINSIYFLSFYFNPFLSLVISFFSGLLYDIFAPARYGIHIFAFTTLSYFIILTKNKIYWSNISAMIFIFLTSFFVRFIVEFPYNITFKNLLHFIIQSLFLGSVYNTLIGLIFLIYYKKKYET